MLLFSVINPDQTLSGVERRFCIEKQNDLMEGTRYAVPIYQYTECGARRFVPVFLRSSPELGKVVYYNQPQLQMQNWLLRELYNLPKVS